MTANWTPEPMKGSALRLAQDLHKQMFVQGMFKRRYSQLPEAKKKKERAKCTSSRLFSKENTSLYLLHTDEQKGERQRKSGQERYRIPQIS